MRILVDPDHPRLTADGRGRAYLKITRLRYAAQVGPVELWEVLYPRGVPGMNAGAALHYPRPPALRHYNRTGEFVAVKKMHVQYGCTDGHPGHRHVPVGV